MGKPDVSVKGWLRDPKRFADLFNGILFGGKQLIMWEKLVEVNSESSFIVVDKNKKSRSVEKYRDIIMRWGNDLYLVLLAVEIQDETHYAMPVRKMLYDALTYTNQMRELWQKLPEDAPEKKIGSKEFFSRFRKGDRIYPVITVVFYYGDEWDGNIDLFDMFGFRDDIVPKEDMETLKRYVSNYKVNVFNPMKENNLSVFKTDLQIVFGMLKYKQDKENILRYTEQHSEYFTRVDYETAQAIKAMLGTGDLLKDKLEARKEGNNVCKALHDLYDDGKAEGLAEGKAEGLAEGLLKGKILTMFEFGLSPEDIAYKVEQSVGYVNEVLGLQSAR